jgi:hypothetical protein
MVASYLDGAIAQLKARARHVLGLVRSGLGRDVDVLVGRCRERLIGLQRSLEELQTDVYLLPENQNIRLRRYRRAIEDLDLIESVVVAALNRWLDQDHRMNQLAGAIAQEIRFPLVTPIVSCTSPWQHYFRTYPDWSLIVVPLAEGQFLLHLPDLYHEFAHALLDNDADPRLDGFQSTFKDALMYAWNYTATEIAKEERKIGPPALAYQRYLLTWQYSWHGWMTEFFCDLYATYLVGPAFAWAHYHLCASTGAYPYQTPLIRPSSHPADAARMDVMLMALDRMGFSTAKNDIAERWNGLLKMDNARSSAEYRRCFPDHVLAEIAKQAHQAMLALDCEVIKSDALKPIAALLNEAWNQFWTNPSGYVAWETSATERLFDKIVAPNRLQPLVEPQR